ncbi:MAG: pyridoxamine 5'-phosphate oxidase [Phycisphaerales bacterium]|nr:pyridoxamine 5'-phosphate oxidase [Phycisphaerales bacterium]
MPERPVITASTFDVNEVFPDVLPNDPFPIFRAWYNRAHADRTQPNPSAMTVATVDPDGRPSARIVLCRGIGDPGYVVFFTNRLSRKGRALQANPRAAIIFHWDHADRQVRIEGPVVQSPDDESDQYFFSRHPASRLGAWASDQSRPIASRDDLLAKVMDTMRRFNVDLDSADEVSVPRPPHWGGYRVWAESVELWIGSPVRVHERALWTRTLTPTPGQTHAFAAGPWSATRLQP